MELSVEELQRRLNCFVKEGDNNKCADCRSPQPRWGVWNIGAFVCMTCAGIHRGLGVHISKVRSLHHDSWNALQVGSMMVGNEVVNNHYEAKLPTNFVRPHSKHDGLVEFIVDKYKHKKYYGKPVDRDTRGRILNDPELDDQQLDNAFDELVLNRTGASRVLARSDSTTENSAAQMPTTPPRRGSPNDTLSFDGLPIYKGMNSPTTAGSKETTTEDISVKNENGFGSQPYTSPPRSPFHSPKKAPRNQNVSNSPKREVMRQLPNSSRNSPHSHHRWPKHEMQFQSNNGMRINPNSVPNLTKNSIPDVVDRKAIPSLLDIMRDLDGLNVSGNQNRQPQDGIIKTQNGARMSREEIVSLYHQIVPPPPIPTMTPSNHQPFTEGFNTKLTPEEINQSMATNFITARLSARPNNVAAFSELNPFDNSSWGSSSTRENPMFSDLAPSSTLLTGSPSMPRSPWAPSVGELNWPGTSSDKGARLGGATSAPLPPFTNLCHKHGDTML